MSVLSTCSEFDECEAAFELAELFDVEAVVVAAAAAAEEAVAVVVVGAEVAPAAIACCTDIQAPDISRQNIAEVLVILWNKNAFTVK